MYIYRIYSSLLYYNTQPVIVESILKVIQCLIGIGEPTEVGGYIQLLLEKRTLLRLNAAMQWAKLLAENDWGNHAKFIFSEIWTPEATEMAQRYWIQSNKSQGGIDYSKATETVVKWLGLKIKELVRKQRPWKGLHDRISEIWKEWAVIEALHIAENEKFETTEYYYQELYSLPFYIPPSPSN